MPHNQWRRFTHLPVESKYTKCGYSITYSYAPINDDVVTCEMLSSITCAATNPVTSNAVTITVNPILTASVTIAADANPVCPGSNVTFTPTPTHGGPAPTYEWYVTPSGGTASLSGSGSTFNYAPADGDAVYAIMTSNATPCLTGSPATSNTETITFFVPVAGTITPVSPICAYDVPVQLEGLPAGGTFSGTDVTTGGLFTPITVGDQIITYTTIDANGCTASTSTTITVNSRPQLEMAVNGVTIMDNHDGTDDTGAFDICNLVYNNISITQMTDLAGSAPTSSVKVQRIIIPDNVNISMFNGTYRLSDYSLPYRRTASLINPALQGTIEMRFRVFFDDNLNNILDANECAGDWIVYTATVNPVVPASVSIVADANSVNTGTTVNFTATPVNGGTTPSYQWYKGTSAVGTNSPNFSYMPAHGDVISVVMTSSFACTQGSPATSNAISMIVGNPPQLEMTVNGSTVTDNNDGTDDTGAFDVCNLVYNNVSITQMTDLHGLTPTSSVKVQRIIIPDNVNISMFNGTYRLSDYSLPYRRTASLINPASSGTIEMRFRVFFDDNNNNIVDAGERAGDWIVYTATVNPVVPASVSIVADANSVNTGTTVNFTATPVNGGTTPSYQWYKGTSAVGTNSPNFSYMPAHGDVISVVMTSSFACTQGSPATSNAISMIVGNPPQLEMTVNGSTVTDNNDGTDDTGAFDVCNLVYNNVSITQMTDLHGLTPTSSVKVQRIIIPDNVNISMFNGTYRLSDYSLPYRRTASLINPASSGTIEMRFRVFFDDNNNNIVDAGERAGDWIVYTATVNPVVPASVSIVADANSVNTGTTVNFTATPVNGGTTPSYQWYKGTSAVGTNSPNFSYMPAHGDVISVVMTSSFACTQGSPATSNAISMIVGNPPQLEMTVNGSTVTDNNDGTDDTGAFDVCNLVYNNVSITQMTDLHGLTPTSSVKVQRIIIPDNVNISMFNGTYRLSDYSLPYRRTASLINPASSGTIEMRFRVFFDDNNNNIVDAGERAGDWIVYTVTVTNCVKSAEITTSTFDTPQMELGDLKVYPNPFSDRLRFEFSAPESVNARIDLYDMTGRMVKTIFEQAIEGGVNYNAEFKPEATVSGMYIYRMTMGEKVYNGKVVFRK